MLKRRRFKQTLQDRQLLEEAAQLLPPGARRDAMLNKLLRPDTAAHIDWANSPGLQPPTETMDFVERCFVAMTVAGFIGIIAVLIWMWP
jgi:hypothetical protein